jgi:segregation and condensation protein B
MNNNKIIEGLLYIKGSEGIDPKTLKVLLGINTNEARKELKMFMNEFNGKERGIKVVVFKDVFKFTTLPEHKEIISDLVTIERKKKLSESAIETIGIIAYKQPVTRAQVSNIRGKISDGVMSTLLIKELIKEVGIKETPGRPILYGITDKFYDYFQITSLKELPKLDEFSNYDEDEEIKEFDLFSSQRNDQTNKVD